MLTTAGCSRAVRSAKLIGAPRGGMAAGSWAVTGGVVAGCERWRRGLRLLRYGLRKHRDRCRDGCGNAGRQAGNQETALVRRGVRHQEVSNFSRS
jgi:hypothetical protein